MKFYQFKIYLPIFRQGEEIIIGNPNSNNSISIACTDSNLKLLARPVEEEISEVDINNHPLYAKMLAKGLLEIKDGIETQNRNDLYLKYLNGRYLSDAEKQFRILIFGAGAGGSNVAYQLAQYGYENIILVDFDNVAKSDYTKSMVFTAEMVGKKKVVAIAERIKSDFGITVMHETVNINDYVVLERFINKVKPNFILKACDPDGGFRKHLNEIAFKLRIPFMLMSYSFSTVNVGPIYVPGATSCDNSLVDEIKEQYGDNYADDVISYRLFKDRLIHPSTAPNATLLACLVTKDIVHFSMKAFNNCKTVGRLLMMDVETLQYRRMKVDCKQECSICTDQKIISNV